MSSEVNKALVRRYIDEVFNNGNAGALPELFADGFRGQANGQSIDREGIRRGVESWRGAGVSTRTTIDDLLVDGDKVVARLTMHGSRHGGGEQLSTRIVIFRVADGKFVESWAESSNPIS